MSEEKIRVGLVEDQLLFRQGLKAILSYQKDIEVVFESADGYSVIEKLSAGKDLPHILLVDLSLPPNGKKEYNGLQLTDDICSQFPDIRVLILSVHNDDNLIAQLIQHGAAGYLVKDCDPHEVYDAIQSVHVKGTYINETALKAIQSNLGKRSKPKALSAALNLTKREIEILQLICQQNTTEEIAEKLFISPKTVDGHRNNLLQKTGSRNTVGLVLFAVSQNLLSK
ncbi:MAG: response regulator transcription factor [Cyclobacteriaceae bacterium]|nr:response regulator transcription factor [Cyclobacteriaceae bacterium]